MRQNGLQQAKICRYFTVIANLKKKIVTCKLCNVKFNWKKRISKSKRICTILGVMVSQISKYSSFPDLRRKINSVIKDRSKFCSTVLFDYTNWTCSLFSNWTDLSHLFHSLPLFVSNDFVTVSSSFYFLFVSLALIIVAPIVFFAHFFLLSFLLLNLLDDLSGTWDR